MECQRGNTEYSRPENTKELYLDSCTDYVINLLEYCMCMRASAIDLSRTTDVKDRALKYMYVVKTVECVLNFPWY